MILLILIWGYAWIATKIALRYASALDVSVVRVALGTLFLFAFLLWSKASLRPAHWKWLIVIGLLQTATFSFMNRFTDGLRLPSEDEAVRIYRETYGQDFERVARR